MQKVKEILLGVGIVLCIIGVIVLGMLRSDGYFENTLFEIILDKGFIVFLTTFIGVFILNFWVNDIFNFDISLWIFLIILLVIGIILVIIAPQIVLNIYFGIFAVLSIISVVVNWLRNLK